MLYVLSVVVLKKSTLHSEMTTTRYSSSSVLSVAIKLASCCNVNLDAERLGKCTKFCVSRNTHSLQELLCGKKKSDQMKSQTSTAFMNFSNTTQSRYGFDCMRHLT